MSVFNTPPAPRRFAERETDIPESPTEESKEVVTADIIPLEMAASNIVDSEVEKNPRTQPEQLTSEDVARNLDAAFAQYAQLYPDKDHSPIKQMADACKQQLNYSRQAKFMIDETRKEMNRSIDEVNTKLDKLMQTLAQTSTGAGPSPPGTGRTTTPVQQTPFLNEPPLPQRINRNLPGLPIFTETESPIRQIQLDERFGNIIIQFSRTLNMHRTMQKRYLA